MEGGFLFGVLPNRLPSLFYSFAVAKHADFRDTRNGTQFANIIFFSLPRTREFAAFISRCFAVISQATPQTDFESLRVIKAMQIKPKLLIFTS